MFSRTLKHIKTLVYYDGPQLFLAEDQVSSLYICLSVEDDGYYCKFLCVPISKFRLSHFLNDQIDLRKLFEDPEIGDYYIADSSILLDSNLEANSIATDQIPKDYFPSEGFYFSRPSFNVDELYTLSQKRRKGIVLLRLSDRSASSNAITSSLLSQGLQRFQTFIKASYKRSLSSIKPSIRKHIDSPDYWNMETFGFSEGSFTIHLQTKNNADLAGNIELDRAFIIMNSITASVIDIDKSIEELRKYKGHVVSAYKNLLEFIIQSDITLSYAWQTPLADEPIKRILAKWQVGPLYERFKDSHELSKETVTITGVLLKGDISQRGSWILIDENDIMHRGATDPTIGESLQGITLGARYAFRCEEQIDEHPITGQETKKLILLSHDELPPLE